MIKPCVEEHRIYLINEETGTATARSVWRKYSSFLAKTLDPRALYQDLDFSQPACQTYASAIAERKKRSYLLMLATNMIILTLMKASLLKRKTLVSQS